MDRQRPKKSVLVRRRRSLSSDAMRPRHNYPAPNGIIPGPVYPPGHPRFESSRRKRQARNAAERLMTGVVPDPEMTDDEDYDDEDEDYRPKPEVSRHQRSLDNTLSDEALCAGVSMMEVDDESPPPPPPPSSFIGKTQAKSVAFRDTPTTSKPSTHIPNLQSILGTVSPVQRPKTTSRFSNLATQRLSMEPDKSSGIKTEGFPTDPEEIAKLYQAQVDEINSELKPQVAGLMSHLLQLLKIQKGEGEEGSKSDGGSKKKK